MSRTDNHNENTNYINVEYFFHIIFNTEMSVLSIDDIDFHDAKKSMKIHKNSISIYNFKIIIHEKKFYFNNKLADAPVFKNLNYFYCCCYFVFNDTESLRNTFIFWKFKKLYWIHYKQLSYL